MLMFMWLACLPAVTGHAVLVESMPTDLSLQPTSSTMTVDALVQLVNSTKEQLDISVMYWNLITGPKKLSPADYSKFRAQAGQDLYNALDGAAQRGVAIRFLQGKGISSNHIEEVEALQQKYPSAIQLRTWNATAWYGGGIMHQKMWIGDRTNAYIGSSNMDWLSLTQVKELGVFVTDDTTLGNDAGLNATTDTSLVSTVFDEKFTTERQVPCWSPLVNAADRCKNPLVVDPTASTQYNRQHQMELGELTERAAANTDNEDTYVAASPMELNEVSPSPCPSQSTPSSHSSGAAGLLSPLPCLPLSDRQPRTWDQDALVQTVLGAKSEVSLSVMDFIPASLYSPPKATLWWHDLSDALIVAATTKGVRVRMLISRWNHTSPRALPYLQAMATGAGACNASKAYYLPSCAGSLEIRYFEVKGWNTSAYPVYSRVNHAKYIVSDQRVNIGTSNMVWGYFHNTAGMSLNSGNPGLVKSAQAIFDRDWDSEYATPIPK